MRYVRQGLHAKDEGNEMTDTEIQLLMTFVAVFCAYKVGYWTGCRDTSDWAIEQVQGIFETSKKSGDAQHAQQIRKD